MRHKQCHAERELRKKLIPHARTSEDVTGRRGTPQDPTGYDAPATRESPLFNPSVDHPARPP